MRFVAVLTLLGAGMVGCTSSSSPEMKSGGSGVQELEQMCDSWQEIVAAFESFDEIAISLGGIRGLEQAVDRMNDALSNLAASSDALLGPRFEALGESVEELIDMLASPGLSMAYLNELLTKSDDIDAAWGELVDFLQVDCPDVEVTTA